MLSVIIMLLAIVVVVGLGLCGQLAYVQLCVCVSCAAPAVVSYLATNTRTETTETVQKYNEKKKMTQNWCIVESSACAHRQVITSTKCALSLSGPSVVVDRFEYHHIRLDGRG